MNNLLPILGITLLILISGCSSGPPPGFYDNFAKCTAEKGAVMYGAYWCLHCEKVKKQFGDSFRYVNYVECDPKGENAKPELCIENNIEEYATFIFADGSRLTGEPTLKQIADKACCTLPELE